MNTTVEIAENLRTIYGDMRTTETEAFAALLRYAQNQTPDETAQLAAFGLDKVVIDVLVEGTPLAYAGKVASGERYDTANQARAYAIALIHQAGRVLVWNAKVFVPHRQMSAALAERYRMLKAIRAVAERQDIAA